MSTLVPVDSRTLGRRLFNGAAAATLGFILLPLIFVIWLAFFRQEIPAFPPDGYSLKWFAAIANHDKFMPRLHPQPAGCGGRHPHRRRSRGPCRLSVSRASAFSAARCWRVLLLLPLVVPGLCSATSIYVFHVELTIRDRARGDRIGRRSRRRPCADRDPLVRAPGRRSLAGADRSIEEAAQRPGRDAGRHLLPGDAADHPLGHRRRALFGFVVSFGNLEMSLFLVGVGRTTLPIAILQYLDGRSTRHRRRLGPADPPDRAAMVVTDRFVKLSRVV